MSAEAFQAITECIPLDLLMIERNQNYDEKLNGDRTERTLEQRQRRWDGYTTKGLWTKNLIPCARPWLECKDRKLEYFLIQFLTLHGYLRTCTH